MYVKGGTNLKNQLGNRRFRATLKIFMDNSKIKQQGAYVPAKLWWPSARYVPV